MWTPDLFMQPEDNGDWSFFCPNECPGLQDVYGAEFKAMFEDYERGMARETLPARVVWDKIVEAQIETGTPYMLYKDAANEKSNQKNLGTIRSSNLCTEIMEYTAKDEVAVCNLASIALPKFVNTSEGVFDHQLLYDVTYHATGNLNRVIDVNYYPVEEARNSNMRHRPIGLGVQGLADVFAMLKLPFESPAARTLNKEIFETIYFAACTASKDAAVAEGAYSTFEGSPASQGLLQFDLWGMNEHSGRWDWDSLKAEIVEKGMRNSLLLAPMPTASTSQILGNNECFEAFTSNLYVRRTLSGEFVVLNKHLVADLIAEDMWSLELKDEILRHKGPFRVFSASLNTFASCTRPRGKSSSDTCSTWQPTAGRTSIRVNRSTSTWWTPIRPKSHRCTSTVGSRGSRPACTIFEPRRPQTPSSSPSKPPPKRTKPWAVWPSEPTTPTASTPSLAALTVPTTA